MGSMTRPAALVAVLALVAAACTNSTGGATGSPPADTPAATPAATLEASASPSPAAEQYVANAADFVAAADWDSAIEVTIELSEFAFAPKDLTLVAGQPYVLKVSNVGTVKHEFTAGEFFRTVATRKAETAESEVKVPYFTEIEVFAGKAVEIYLIPLVPGTYELVCEIEGHLEAGMLGSITVTGEAPASPAIELGDVAAGPWVQDGADRVSAADWDTAQHLTIELSEFAFTPDDIALEAGQPYVITVLNVGAVKHEFTAGDFFGSVAFRKAEDASGEFKAPAPHEIEVFAGKEIEMYMIPTTAGRYQLVCEIEGHLEAGMSGTIDVASGT